MLVRSDLKLFSSWTKRSDTIIVYSHFHNCFFSRIEVYSVDYFFKTADDHFNSVDLLLWVKNVTGSIIELISLPSFDLLTIWKGENKFWKEVIRLYSVECQVSKSSKGFVNNRIHVWNHRKASNMTNTIFANNLLAPK